MLSEELAAVRCDLEDFAAEMFEPFARLDQRRWGGVYLRGLSLDGGRKSVEPMAARLGEDGNRQALAHFVTSSPWDAAPVRARLAWRMQPVIRPTALVVDDTGFLKDGDASACVTRQDTGTAGKVTNCQAGVSLPLASNGASAAVHWRLFLPGSWDPASPKADPAKVARRDKCAVPAQVGHVEKWQLALDMIDETRSWGIEVPQVIADGGYGDTAAFRLGLETRNLDYVVGISTTTTAQPEDARPSTPTYLGRGRRPVPAYPEPAQRVKDLVLAVGKSSARPVQWREGSRPGNGCSGVKRMYSRFVALRIRPAGREIRQATTTAELPVRWLLAEWPADQDEPAQFWLSNLPETTPLPVLVRTAKLRRRIENDYREMKQALGLAHFEGRTWPGLAPPRHPRLDRPRLLHPAATEPIPKRDSVGLSLYRVIRELQTLLATRTGACPICHRDMPDPAPTIPEPVDQVRNRRRRGLALAVRFEATVQVAAIHQWL